MNKKGFTLIELLAVIIILGILMIIAIPSVTRYISDSRKSSYVDTAKEIIGGARNLVNDGKLEMYDTDTTYYIESSCIKTENESKSPYGEFTRAYVVVTYDGKGYTYYWTSNDDAGQGIKEIIRVDKLDTDNIESDLKDSDISTLRGIDGRSKTVVVSKQNNCQKEGANQATIRVNGETGEENKPICRRAETLHTEECRSTGSYCHSDGYEVGDTVTYGNQNTTKGVLATGDAFDCDVTGNGDYKRFYYVSDYYDTYSNSFDNNYAVLIYYTNFVNGVESTHGAPYATQADAQLVGTCDNANGCHIYGPVSSLNHLPSVNGANAWRNDLLKTKIRKITLCTNSSCSTPYSSYDGYDYPNNFNYGDSAARLITLKEVHSGCYDGRNSLSNTGALSIKCRFLFENTLYAGSGSREYGSWVENPTSEFYIDYSWDLNCSSRKVTGYPTGMAAYGIRPTIEVNKYYIDY